MIIYTQYKLRPAIPSKHVKEIAKMCGNDAHPSLFNVSYPLYYVAYTAMHSTRFHTVLLLLFLSSITISCGVNKGIFLFTTTHLSVIDFSFPSLLMNDILHSSLTIRPLYHSSSYHQTHNCQNCFSSSNP